MSAKLSASLGGACGRTVGTTVSLGGAWGGGFAMTGSIATALATVGSGGVTGAALDVTGAALGGSGAALGGTGAALVGSGAALGSSGAALGGSGAALGGSGAAVVSLMAGGVDGAEGPAELAGTADSCSASQRIAASDAVSSEGGFSVSFFGGTVGVAGSGATFGSIFLPELASKFFRDCSVLAFSWATLSAGVSVDCVLTRSVSSNEDALLRVSSVLDLCSAIFCAGVILGALASAMAAGLSPTVPGVQL
mmetsp:Transcript_26042/g.52216  ORF Transcript_26042/g.52216 Transcript_26042/m.52216 type:complete len:251 (+) Transcript_26042:1115-1867(+)